MKKYKYKNIINLLVVFFIITSTNAQEKTGKPIANINAIARYFNNSVELRFFPDKRKILYQGLKNGFAIKRAILPDPIPKVENIDDIIKFETIGITKVLSENEWQKLINNADEKSKKNLQLAKDFLNNIDKDKGGKFSLDKGIKQLKEEKSRESFEYLIFVMTAIKDKNVAKALGLGFIDQNIIKNRRYLYKVEVLGESKLYTINSIVFSIQTKKEQLKKRKIYVKPGDTKLSFMWEENDMISGGLVERKNNKTGKWEQLNKVPVYTLGNSVRNGYTDKGLTNYVTYEYRFYGYNPFGEKILFGTAKGMPRDLTPPKKPIFKSAKHTKPNEITIKWDVYKPMDNDLRGFIIARSNERKGKFKILHKKILSKNTRQYKDNTFKKDETNYYVIQAIDTAGNISSTVPAFVTIIDSIPPKKPAFVSGKIDSLGVVTLTVKLNKEKDLMGYRLYKANSPKHEFSVIREGFDDNDSIQKPVQLIFKDTVTLNSLTPYIYYRVKALDKNFNQSEFSDILKVKRPDKIAPVIPVFKKVVVGKNQVSLSFAPSTSEDVEKQFIYRKTNIKDEWKLLAELDKNQNKYIDKKVKQGVKYYYSLRAVDDSGNYSKFSVAIFATPYDDGVLPVVKEIKKQKTKDMLVLQWTYPKKYKDVYFVIYKKNRKGNLVQYKSINKPIFSEKYNPGNTYAIKAFTKKGGESKISKTIKLQKS